MYETLTWEVDADGVATLTLSRPDALNAFDLTMARELEQVFLTDARDDAVRAVVVTGEGRAFCAGMDLSARATSSGSTRRSRRPPRSSGRRTTPSRSPPACATPAARSRWRSTRSPSP